MPTAAAAAYSRTTTSLSSRANLHLWLASATGDSMTNQKAHENTADRLCDAGDTTPDQLKHAGATAQEMAANAAEQARQFGEKAQNSARQFIPFVERSLRDQPMTTLAGAAAIGFLLGALWKKYRYRGDGGTASHTISRPSAGSSRRQGPPRPGRRSLIGRRLDFRVRALGPVAARWPRTRSASKSPCHGCCISLARLCKGPSPGAGGFRSRRNRDHHLRMTGINMAKAT